MDSLYFNVMLDFEIVFEYFEFGQNLAVFRDCKGPVILCSNICECYKIFAATITLCFYGTTDISNDQVTWS